MNRNHLSKTGWRGCVLLSAALGLAACANDVPPPTAQLGASSQAVLTAERAGAPRFAPAELQAARDKLAAADAAMRADERTRARRLAEQAQADAELATVRAQRAVSQEAAGVVRQQAAPQQAMTPPPVVAPPAVTAPAPVVPTAPTVVVPGPVTVAPTVPSSGTTMVMPAPAAPPGYSAGATSWGTTTTYEQVRP